jgi:hypothetical protein
LRYFDPYPTPKSILFQGLFFWLGKWFESQNETNLNLKPKTIYKGVFEVVEVVGVFLVMISWIVS